MELTLEQKIIEKTVILFNKKGLSHTSLRDIAAALDISDGHLRYYFKTKEDLVLSTFRLFLAEIASFENADKRNFEKIHWQNMADALIQTFNAMYKFSYFYKDPFALDQYPSVRKEYNKLITNRKQVFKTVFEVFQRNGVFDKGIDKSLLPAFYEQFFIISDNWIKYSAKHKGDISAIIKHYVALCLALLLPCFTSTYEKEVKTWVKAHLVSTL